MKRREFLTAAAATVLVPAMASAKGFQDYEPGLVQKALADGKTVFIDYSAKWCGTCARQERVINAIRESNPAYDEKLMFVKIDWDTYRSHDVTTSRNIPRRSTLLVLRGDQELGRLVAGTGESEIKQLMDLGL